MKPKIKKMHRILNALHEKGVSVDPRWYRDASKADLEGLLHDLGVLENRYRSLWVAVLDAREEVSYLRSSMVK